MEEIYYTIIEDEDEHRYIIPEDKYEEMKEYLDKFYRLCYTGREGEAYDLDIPIKNLEDCVYEGGQLFFKEYKIV